MRPEETARGVGWGLGRLLRRHVERERLGDELEGEEQRRLAAARGHDEPPGVDDGFYALVFGVFLGFAIGFLLAMVIWL